MSKETGESLEIASIYVQLLPRTLSSLIPLPFSYNRLYKNITVADWVELKKGQPGDHHGHGPIPSRLPGTKDTAHLFGTTCHGQCKGIIRTRPALPVAEAPQVPFMRVQAHLGARLRSPLF